MYGILCDKWPHICSVCRNHNPVSVVFIVFHFISRHALSNHRLCNKINTMDDTSWAGTATRPEYLSLPRGFRVAQSVVFYLVCFSRRVMFKAVNISCQLSWINWFAIVYEQCFIFLWYWWVLFSWGYKWYTYNNSARFSATDCNF